MTQEKSKSKDDKSKSTSAVAKAAGTKGPQAEKPEQPAPDSKKGKKEPPKSALVEDIEVPIDSDELELEEELEEEDPPLDTNLVADTSERTILIVDEDGQRRNETVAIVTKILPNAVIETANDPEDAYAMMGECDFDTYVVNFLMPGYSSSDFVKAVVNHPEHPLLVGFAADKMSDAVDPKKGLKIIPLKRLFDLNADTATDSPEGEAAD